MIKVPVFNLNRRRLSQSRLIELALILFSCYHEGWKIPEYKSSCKSLDMELGVWDHRCEPENLTVNCPVNKYLFYTI